ncbi:MAG TPA: DUF4159 domain-containing protein [Armatimonadota bacterium]|nr:DUF4159 domain-containing protein [Armatimonadota bacterium]
MNPDKISINWGLRESMIPSLILHLLFFWGLMHMVIPSGPRTQNQIGLKVRNPAPQHAISIKLVELPPAKTAAAIPERRPVIHRIQRQSRVPRRNISPRPARQPVARHRKLATPAPHPTHTAPTLSSHEVTRVLRHLVIVKRPANNPVESTFHPVLPDPFDRPDARADIRSTDVHLPDGMRLDRNTPLRMTHELPKGVPMALLPRHIPVRQNGSGNSQNQAEAGPKMALLTHDNGMGLDTFKPVPHSAGGGPTQLPGADNPNPGSGGIPAFSGAMDKVGSAEPSPQQGGGPIGFHGPAGKPRPGLSGVMTAPNSSWKTAIATGPNGSLGTGAGRSGRGGGGIGGPESAPGIFSMRPGHAGGPGEGAGGGIGGGIGRGVGRGIGAGIGGGDGRGGGGGGAGLGHSVGAGTGGLRPGTLGNGIPSGIGQGGGGGRQGLFHRGGGGGLRPGGGGGGQQAAAFGIGCVLTNQQPAFNAARWHDRSMTSLLQWTARHTDIKVHIPPAEPDSYVNAVDGDMNQERPFTYDDIRGYPMIFMTGDRFFTLTAGERAALRRYVLQDGGTIYGEDCHAPGSQFPPKRGGFDKPFRQYMEDLFGKPFEPLPQNHPIYEGLDTIPKGDMGENYGFIAIKIGGRDAIIYTVDDYGDVWSPVHHYYPASRRGPAYHLGSNLFLYALKNFIEFHPG